MANLEFRRDVSMQDWSGAKIVPFYLTQRGDPDVPDCLPARAVGYPMLPFDDEKSEGQAPRHGLRVGFGPCVGFEKPATLLNFGPDPLQWYVRLSCSPTTLYSA